jgi:hypothetical protein
MQRNRLWVLSLLFLCGLVFACLANLRLTVLYDQTDELKAGDRVIWQEQTIGEVQMPLVAARRNCKLREIFVSKLQTKVAFSSRLIPTIIGKSI